MQPAKSALEGMGWELRNYTTFSDKISEGMVEMEKAQKEVVETENAQKEILKIEKSLQDMFKMEKA